MTLGPIRCTLCVKGSLDPGGNQRTKSTLSPERVHRAETYANVIGVRPPSQPRIKPGCTLFFDSAIYPPMFTPRACTCDSRSPVVRSA